MDKSLVISFIIYLTAMVGVGFLTYRLSKTFADFMLAGRKLGSWVTAISAQASDMSGWLLIGVPGEAIKKGFGIVWTAIGCVLGKFFNWTVLSRRLRRYSEVLDALTIPDFLAMRFSGQAQNAPDLSGLIWELVPGFGVAIIAIVAVSLATAKPREEVFLQFDMVSDYSKKLETVEQ